MASSTRMELKRLSQPGPIDRTPALALAVICKEMLQLICGGIYAHRKSSSECSGWSCSEMYKINLSRKTKNLHLKIINWVMFE